jgi:hypothetical protein
VRFCGRALAEPVGVFLLLFSATIVTQIVSRAWSVELGGDESDEAAHYVTGLMVRDYLAQGVPAGPRRFAEDYYRHYPKIGFGHWPPVFYLVQTAWTLPFGVSRESMMLMMAALSALLGLLLYYEAQRRFGWAPALSAALLMLSLPRLQILSRAVMAELLVALLVWLAISAYGRYLESGDWREAAWFGLWASAAILTKGTAFALALVPLFAVLLTRRWSLLKNPTFWIPLGLVLVLCGPWYALAPDARHEKVLPYGGLSFWPWSLLRTPPQWIAMLGWLPAGLFMAGLAERIWALVRTRSVSGFWVAAVSLMGGLTVLRLFVGVSRNPRTLTLAVPLALLFALHAGSWLARRMPRKAILAGGVLILTAVAGVNIGQVEPKPSRGFVEIAHDVIADPALGKTTMLISSDPFGEGMFIAEMAMHENRPGHVIVRASKALADVGWMGQNYALRYRSPEEVRVYLADEGIGLIVVDDGGGTRMPHRDVLARFLASSPDWAPAEAAGSVRVYRRRGSSRE